VKGATIAEGHGRIELRTVLVDRHVLKSCAPVDCQ
jgi:hypothetical protein